MLPWRERKYRVTCCLRMVQRWFSGKEKNTLYCVVQYLLVPALGSREHPLFIDEHSSTEVVAIVQRHHPWLWMCNTLRTSDNSFFTTGCCHCVDIKHTHVHECYKVPSTFLTMNVESLVLFIWWVFTAHYSIMSSLSDFLLISTDTIPND